MKGIIFDIKRFAVHDGPGIRTTVFSKGCMLNCPWCQNPEGHNLNVNLWYFQNKCIQCKQCLNVCPFDDLSHTEDKEPFILIDKEKCQLCGACVQCCPSHALVFDGRKVDSQEVVDEILKDKVFYDVSGGGVTLSGGDPLFQYEFNLDILKKCKQQKIHCVVESCLSSEWEILKRFIEYVDLFLIDMKLARNDLFEKFIGSDNQRIKENFEKLIQANAEIMVRIPLIPEATATEDNITAIADYLKTCEFTGQVELINFNPLAADKYRRMNKPYAYDQYKDILPEKQLQIYRQILASKDISVYA